MINLVHDVAEAYRQLVFANSYPGDPVNLKEYTLNNTIKTQLSNELLLFAWMLLDGEVSFAVVGDETGEISLLLKRLTYGKNESLEEADYIFVLNRANLQEKQDAFRKAKIGNLIDPHISATIICEADSVVEGDTYRVSGTGINGIKTVAMKVFDLWNELRQEKNKEFPLGIEMYFVDDKSNLLAFPRTTEILEGGI